MAIRDDHPFALCLTHDVDRVYKTYQSVYYAVTDREPRHLLDLLPGRNPYWQFEDVMALESELGVRSAFYVLDEQNLFRDRPLSSWLDPEDWKLYAGRYSLDDPAIERALGALDAGGWEIGLHGSYDSYQNPERLRREKSTLEEKVDQPILGGRQHYLNLERPRTWEHHADVGLHYDATLGSTEEFGFEHGYDPLRPFDDEFVVFPLTLMEAALPDVENNPEAAWCQCLSLLEEAKANNAVMSVLWHPARFNETEYPNYRALYRRLIEHAQEMGAWVGPPGELYRSLEHPSEATAVTTPEQVATGEGTATEEAGATTEPASAPEPPVDVTAEASFALDVPTADAATTDAATTDPTTANRATTNETTADPTATEPASADPTTSDPATADPTADPRANGATDAAAASEDD